LFLGQGDKFHFLAILPVKDLLLVPHSAAPTGAQLPLKRHTLTKIQQRFVTKLSAVKLSP
jgi:hypothetical protein